MATSEQTFAVSVPSLFSALANPDTYPHWLVGARRIRSVSDDWPQPGSFFEHTVGVGPIVIPDRTTVQAMDSPRMLELLVRARPFLEAVVRFDIQGSATGCRVVMRESPVGVYRAISAVAQPLIRARNECSLQRLKSFVESPPKVWYTHLRVRRDNGVFRTTDPLRRHHDRPQHGQSYE